MLHPVLGVTKIGTVLHPPKKNTVAMLCEAKKSWYKNNGYISSFFAFDWIFT